jgi:Xaa-Pro aminopeptidase
MLRRLAKLRDRMLKNKIPGLLVTNPVNVAYLSNFAALMDIALVTPKEAVLLTDFCDLGDAREKAVNFQIKTVKGSFLETLIPLLDKFKIKSLGFEAENLSYFRYSKLNAKLKRIRLIPTYNLVEELRSIKDEREIRLIRKAIKISEEALARVTGRIEVALQERKLATLLEYELKIRGADGNAFPPIVSFAARTARPHSRPSLVKLKRGNLITIDYGASYRGYSSDLTRSFVLGKATKRQKNLYSLLYRAQKKAIEELRPGITCARVDSVARNIISKEGYGKFFGHGLGHGIGRQVHEGPYLKRDDNTLLVPGMVVTVEPGIYIPGWGGMRIEDMVLVTREGSQILSKSSPEELPEL